jgi:hypothetical protein
VIKKSLNVNSILFCFSLLSIVTPVSAEHMKVTLKNHTFDITSFCAKPIQFLGRGDYKCNREYAIELISKYSIFENYNSHSINDRGYAVTLHTFNHDKFYTPTYTPNKSTLYIYLTEEELEKIYESGEVTVNFQLHLFSKKLLQKEVEKICRGKVFCDVQENDLEPSLTLDFSDLSINDLKSSCLVEHKQCQKELEALNTPMKRLERFFKKL